MVLLMGVSDRGTQSTEQREELFADFRACGSSTIASEVTSAHPKCISYARRIRAGRTHMCVYVVIRIVHFYGPFYLWGIGRGEGGRGAEVIMKGM